MEHLSTVMEHHRVFVIFVIYFLQFWQVSRSIGLTIDSQLAVVANDCYTRVAIGSKLRDMDVISSIAATVISECEDECSRRRNSCNAFAFGIGAKGNGTCALSTKMPKAEELQTDADYDVYLRSQQSPQCEPDRLFRMGSGGIGQQRRNDTRASTRFGSGLFGPAMPNILPSSRNIDGMTLNLGNDPSDQRYIPSFDDERRTSDIIRNKYPTSPGNSPFVTNAKVDNDPSIYSTGSIGNNRKSTFGQRTNSNPSRSDFGKPSFRTPFADINYESNVDRDLHSYKALTVHNGPFEAFSRPIFVQDGLTKNKSPTDFEAWTVRDPTKYQNAITSHLDQHRNQGYFSNARKSQGIITRPKQSDFFTGNYDISKISRPIFGNSYSFETNGAKISNGGFKDISEIWNPRLLTTFRGFGAKISEKSGKSCYRRLLSGKKSLELHVRRAIECERIDDCHRACDYEKLFICEGFNYRRIGHGTRGTCEMTSTPYSRMDLHRDFVPDSQCDYYEKDPNCNANAPGTLPAWWNQPPRPSQSYGPPYSSNERPDTRPDQRPLNELPRPFDYDRWSSKDVPRPLDFDRRPSNEIPRPLDFDRRPSNEIPRPLDYGQRPAIHDRRPTGIYGNREPYHDAFDRKSYPDDQGVIPGGYPRTDGRFNHNRFSSARPTDFYNRNVWTSYPKFSNRRIDNGPTQDIGTNEIGSYLPDHRKDPTRDWGSYGNVYGGSYGYDTNYVGKFDIPKYYPKPQPKPPRPYENGQYYGEFYNYGGAFGYGYNYIPANQDPLYGGTGRAEECSVRAGAGFRLSRGVVRKTYLTPNLDQCESLCINEKNYICMSFSYRYNVAPTNPTDNCLLSDVSYKDLNFYVDLEPDRDYDIYAMIANARTCGARREPSQYPPDECFWRVRSGFGMPTDVVRKTIIVDDLGQCQVECTVTQDFTCRSFAFKYGLGQERSNIPSNCYLSDWPSQDINPSHMPDMDGAELYERGSFGRGCEAYTVPFFNMGRYNDKQSSRGDDVCYTGYNKPCKLTPYAVLLPTYVNSEQDCRRKCSRMREIDTIPCMSYSYKLTTHGTEENCLLSDIPIRDLRPGLDYVHDDDHVLYAWKDLDPSCIINDYAIDDDHVFGGQNPTRPLLPGPSRPDFSPGANYPSARPDNTYPEPRPFFVLPKPNDHGARPFDPDRPDPVRPYRPGGGYGDYDDKFGYGIRPSGFDHGPGFLYPNEYSTFRYYTVNGYPCKRGTKCERNKIAGFWACETEGGEYGSWDYCCAPTHQCGFSQGYHYPWCYVGSSEDQWRPCSEKYYPYLPSPRPMRPPIISSDERYDRPYRPRDPGYYGRHWPITYLHRQPPPNCTDSIASADDSANRRTNETVPTITIAMPDITTIKSNETSTAIVNRARRRRLRVRTANDTRNDRRAIFSRKIGAGITANDARSRENQTSRERVAKIERVSKPISTELLAVLTVSPLAATNVSNDEQFEDVKNNGNMIRVPLIAPNNSLPAKGA